MTRTKPVGWALCKGDVFGILVMRAGVRVISVTDTMGNVYGQGSPTAWYTTAAGDAAPGANLVTVSFDGPASSFEILGPSNAD